MKRSIQLMLVTVLLAGCWDERLLKDAQLVYTVGYNKNEDGTLTAMLAMPPLAKQNSKGVILKQDGVTLRDTRLDADLRVAEYLDYSKMKIQLMSDELAKDDLYAYLDVVYRNPINNLNAKLAVIEGSIENYLIEDLNSSTDVSEYYAGLVESSEITTVLPKIDVQKACTLMFDPGIDLILPYIGFDEKNNKGRILGIALFSDRKYTGTYLNVEESVLFNLMNNQIADIARFTKKYSEDETPEVANFMTAEVWKTSSKISLKGESLSTLSATIKLDLSIQIEEYAPDHLTGEKRLKEIETWWEEHLKEEGHAILTKMQEVNSDALGFGKRIAAFRPGIWDVEEWGEVYSQMPVQLEVDVKIIGTGIMD